MIVFGSNIFSLTIFYKTRLILMKINDNFIYSFYANIINHIINLIKIYLKINLNFRKNKIQFLFVNIYHFYDRFDIKSSNDNIAEININFTNFRINKKNYFLFNFIICKK